jgi:hypothetical protein
MGDYNMDNTLLMLAFLIPSIPISPGQLGVVWNTLRTLIWQKPSSTSLYVQPS